MADFWQSLRDGAIGEIQNSIIKPAAGAIGSTYGTLRDNALSKFGGFTSRAIDAINPKTKASTPATNPTDGKQAPSPEEAARLAKENVNRPSAGRRRRRGAGALPDCGAKMNGSTLSLGLPDVGPSAFIAKIGNPSPTLPGEMQGVTNTPASDSAS